jgi:hypothetical protein
MSGGFQNIDATICNGTDIGTVAASSLGTTITASASPNTKGSYAQLIASTSSDATWVVVNVGHSTFSSNAMAIDLAVGGAGSEVIFANNLLARFEGTNTSINVWTQYSFPVTIPAGSRIAARCQADNNPSDPGYINLILFDSSFPLFEGVGVDSIGFAAGTTTGTTCTASGSTNTKGSYAQLTASTARDYIGVIPIFDIGSATTPAGDFLYDIAIGAGGSEIVIIPNIPVSKWGSTQGYAQTPLGGPFLPIQIPAGTRISARCQCDTASGFLAITLYGVYA